MKQQAEIAICMQAECCQSQIQLLRNLFFRLPHAEPERPPNDFDEREWGGEGERGGGEGGGEGKGEGRGDREGGEGGRRVGEWGFGV